MIRGLEQIPPGQRDPKWYAFYASHLDWLGDTDRAREVYGAVVEAYPREPRLWFQFGSFETSNGNSERADFSQRGRDQLGITSNASPPSPSPFDHPPSHRYAPGVGELRTVTVEDVIAREGPRQPDHTESQKGFRAATIVVSPDELDGLQLSYFHRQAQDLEAEDEYECTLFGATGGRATLTARLR